MPWNIYAEGRDYQNKIAYMFAQCDLILFVVLTIWLAKSRKKLT